MIKRSFFGLKKPRLEYTLLDRTAPEPKQISTSENVTLFLPSPAGQTGMAIVKEGDSVKTGQKILASETDPAYVTSTVTGTVSSVAPYAGDFGAFFTAISLDVAKQEEMDQRFAESREEPSLDNAKDYLALVPGKPPFEILADPDKSINTIVVTGMDSDLLIRTNQYVLKSKTADIRNGIDILKKITGIDNVVVTAPSNLAGEAAATGAQVQEVSSEYPAAFPLSIMKDVLGQVVPAGKTPEDVGVCFFTAEAVASIGRAYKEGHLPVNKTVTLVKKDETQTLISVRVGTPISEIFKACNVALQERDRLIIGGPLTGTAAYSDAHPVLPDTDAIIVQDSEDLPLVSDYPCINCGECVRACPAMMPVNILVRFLEAGQYEEAADNYDLDSCMACGLCSYVCPSRIPIFQYIRLAESELGRTTIGEE